MNKIIHPVEPEELMAYLDGELTADRATATAEHLGECAECKSLTSELTSVSENLKSWRLEPSNPATPSAIENALGEWWRAPRTVAPVSESRWRAFSQHRSVAAWAGGLAAVLLLLLGTVTWHRPGGRGARFESLVASNKLGELPAGSDAGEAHSAYSASPSPAPLAPSYRGETDQAVGNAGAHTDEAMKKLVRHKQVQMASNLMETRAAEEGQVGNRPMIIRTAQLTVTTKEFDKARANLDPILKRHHGYLGELTVGGNTGSGRTLSATLRVPADQLDATMTEVKALGRVESESQSGQDVTSQYVDLQARLGNARNTEERLTDLLRNRTGQLSDVLAVEQELDRVRGEVEQMEAERKNMSSQVSYAALNATIMEDYKAELQVVPPSTFNRLSNAAVEGYRGMADGVVGLVLFLLSTGPSLLLWGAVLFFPARSVWRRARRSLAS